MHLQNCAPHKQISADQEIKLYLKDISKKRKKIGTKQLQQLVYNEKSHYKINKTFPTPKSELTPLDIQYITSWNTREKSDEEGKI